MRSGSIRVRSAVPGRGFWCRKASLIISTPSSRRGWTACALAIPWTNASTSARSSIRCNFAAITEMVEGNTSGETYQANVTLPDAGCFYPPTLITGLESSDRLMQEEIFGPVLAATTFRTPAEAVALANNTRYGLAASVWSENINLALDVAPKIKAGVVWINATNLFDAAAGFGGLRESGFGREGGWEGLMAYLKPVGKPARCNRSWRAPPRVRQRLSIRLTGRPSFMSAASKPGLMAVIRVRSMARAAASGPCFAGQSQGRAKRGRGGKRRKRLEHDDWPSSRPDPVLPRRKPLGPDKRIRRPHSLDDRHFGEIGTG